jgi:hypothetical protein
MAWSKQKQSLESFLCPALIGRVEYSRASYRYLSDKAGQCYIKVDKKNILNMSDTSSLIPWYKTEQEIKNNQDIQLPVNSDEIERVRKDTKGTVPEERLKVIASNRKVSEYAKEMLSAQSALTKSNFNDTATRFLTVSIEESIESKDILLNILALIDRRVGKKRLLNMADKMKLKHPIVQYFYELRLSSFDKGTD